MISAWQQGRTQPSRPISPRFIHFISRYVTWGGNWNRQTCRSRRNSSRVLMDSTAATCARIPDCFDPKFIYYCSRLEFMWTCADDARRQLAVTTRWSRASDVVALAPPSNENISIVLGGDGIDPPPPQLPRGVVHGPQDRRLLWSSYATGLILLLASWSSSSSVMLLHK